MIAQLKTGRMVEILEIDFGKQPEDTYIMFAVYLDADGECTGAEIEELNQTQYAKLYEAWFEQQTLKAGG